MLLNHTTTHSILDHQENSVSSEQIWNLSMHLLLLHHIIKEKWLKILVLRWVMRISWLCWMMILCSYCKLYFQMSMLKDIPAVIHKNIQTRYIGYIEGLKSYPADYCLLNVSTHMHWYLQKKQMESLGENLYVCSSGELQGKLIIYWNATELLSLITF